jgi:hypothetical protein
MAEFSSISCGGRTGTVCPQTGPYRSSRNARVTVFVKRGAKFPPDTDGAVTTWTIVGGGSLSS